MTEIPAYISDAVNHIPAHLLMLCSEEVTGTLYRKGMAGGIACSYDCYTTGSILLKNKDKNHWAKRLTDIENLITIRINKLAEEGMMLNTETGELVKMNGAES